MFFFSCAHIYIKLLKLWWRIWLLLRTVFFLDLKFCIFSFKIVQIKGNVSVYKKKLLKRKKTFLVKTILIINSLYERSDVKVCMYNDYRLLVYIHTFNLRQQINLQTFILSNEYHHRILKKFKLVSFEFKFLF